jgi:hypothetical protein
MLPIDLPLPLYVEPGRLIDASRRSPPRAQHELGSRIGRGHDRTVSIGQDFAGIGRALRQKSGTIPDAEDGIPAARSPPPRAVNA